MKRCFRIPLITERSNATITSDSCSAAIRCSSATSQIASRYSQANPPTLSYTLFKYLLRPTDPIILEHVITKGTGGQDREKTCYDVVVEVDDPVKYQMSAFLQDQSLKEHDQLLEQKVRLQLVKPNPSYPQKD